MMSAAVVTTSTSRAQIIPSGAYPETSVSSYAYYHCGGFPMTNPCDDIVVNCDMVEVQGNGVIKAVAWSSGYTGNTTLYVEDYAGHSVTIPINGYVGPDVVLAASTSVRSYPSSSGYAVCLVYDKASGTDLYLDVYDLYDVGLPSFYLQSETPGVLINTASTTSSSFSSQYTYTANPSYPHIDMWSDAGTTFNGDPSLHQFVYTWSDGNNVMADVADISNPTISLFSPKGPKKITGGMLPDVAAFTDVNSGDLRFILSYSVSGPSQIQVYEYSMGGVPIPAPVVVDNTTDGYYPRIEALSQYDGRSVKWQIATTVPMGGGPQAVYGYNDLLLGPTDFSTILAPLYSPYSAMGACVAGGLGFGGSSSNVGNTQYTTGFFPWQYNNVYARDVSVATGQLITPLAVYQVNNDSLKYPWDRAVNFALSNCSNTGKDILAAWYNGTNTVYKYSSANAMVFRQIPNGVHTTAGAGQFISVMPNPATTLLQLEVPAQSQYTITDVAGRTLKRGNIKAGKSSVDIHDLSSGMYLLRLQQEPGATVTLRFNKQ